MCCQWIHCCSGDPEDPITVWKKLEYQFQNKTWATKLNLRHKLHSLRLKDGDSVQEHIKAMTEIFDCLSVAGDPVSDKDRVVHLLASLPDSFNMLVTALEANPEVPKMEVVTECLLHEERKLKEQADAGDSRSDKALMVERQPRRKGPQCHHFGKFGHIKRNCYDLVKAKKSGSQKANKVEVKRRDSSSSDSESAGMLVCHALSVSAKNHSDSWIVDSGATCHMCNNVVQSLKESLLVTLGDGHTLEAASRGTVALEMNLPDGTTDM